MAGPHQQVRELVGGWPVGPLSGSNSAHLRWRPSRIAVDRIPAEPQSSPAMSHLQRFLRYLRLQPGLAALTAHLCRAERRTLAAVILGAAALLAFAKIADGIGDGSTRAFDEWLLVALRTPGDLADPIGPKWLEEMMRDFTALGSTGVLTADGAGHRGLPRHDPQGPRRAVRAGLGGRRRARSARP